MMAHEFGLMRRLLKEHSGLNLGEDKQDMLEGKLRPLLREFELPSLSHLVLMMMRPDAHHLRSRVAQAVTVQESYFFRDKVPFNYFVDTMLPKLMARREASRRIRIWCAAAANGQEPYSLAMELAERNGKLAGWTIEIIATDFVEDALGKARKGLYSQFEVQRGLPVSLLVKYFKKVGNAWELSPEIRGKVEFRNPKSPRRLPGARHLRRDLLPERADLFRRGHQTCRACAPSRAARPRRLSRAGRRGDDHRHQSRLRGGARGASRDLQFHARSRRAQPRARGGQTPAGRQGTADAEASDDVPPNPRRIAFPR